MGTTQDIAALTERVRLLEVALFPPTTKYDHITWLIRVLTSSLYPKGVPACPCLDCVARRG